MQILSERLKEERLKAKLTQKEIAEQFSRLPNRKIRK